MFLWKRTSFGSCLSGQEAKFSVFGGLPTGIPHCRVWCGFPSMSRVVLLRVQQPKTIMDPVGFLSIYYGSLGWSHQNLTIGIRPPMAVFWVFEGGF